MPGRPRPIYYMCLQDAPPEPHIRETRSVSSPFISDREPQIISVDEAVSTKFEILGSDRVSDRNKLFVHTKLHTMGALYHSDGRIINMSTRSGGHKGDHVTSVDPLVLLDQNHKCALPRVADSSIFLGNFMNHYGH